MWSKSTRADVTVACLGLTWIRSDVAERSPGAWGCVQESECALDLQAAREGVSSVGIRRFLCR